MALGEFLKAFNVQSVVSIRLGQGIVAKTSFCISVAFIALAVVSLGVRTDWIQAVIVIGVLLTFVIYMVAVLRFAEKNPELALMEGATLLTWKQVQLSHKDGTPSDGQAPVVNPAENIAILANPQKDAL